LTAEPVKDPALAESLGELLPAGSFFAFTAQADDCPYLISLVEDRLSDIKRSPQIVEIFFVREFVCDCYFKIVDRPPNKFQMYLITDTK
jgi:hypothetical protein